MKRLKILLVLENYYPNMGGVEVLFKTLAEGLVAKGHQVHVVTSLLPKTKKYEVINGVKITRVRTPQFARRYFFTFFSIPLVIRLAKHYDIIHAGTYNGSLPAYLGAKLHGKKAFLTYHEAMIDWKSGTYSAFVLKVLQFIEWFLLRIPFKKIICVSKSTQKGILKQGVKKKKTVVVHNALDYTVWDPKKYKGSRSKIRKELGVKPKEFLYVFYGRPGVSKGVEYVIKAISLISELLPHSKGLFILGTEPRDRYNAMKSLLKMNASGNVILHKPLAYRKLPSYLMAADAVVVPSLQEGFGYCVAEACALGIPVVATNTTSIPEVVSGKYVLVPVKNSKAIAKALVYIKEKKYMKTPLKKFTKEQMIDAYERVYGEG